MRWLDSALSWLEKNQREPFFAWVHLYDPHLPYQPPEPYFSRYNYSPPVSLYDGEIAFMDEQIGCLSKWLKANGLEEKPLFWSAIMVKAWANTVSWPMATLFMIMSPCSAHYFYSRTKSFQGKRVSLEVSTVDDFPDGN